MHDDRTEFIRLSRIPRRYRRGERARCRHALKWSRLPGSAPLIYIETLQRSIFEPYLYRRRIAQRNDASLKGDRAVPAYRLASLDARRCQRRLHMGQLEDDRIRPFAVV